MERWDFQLLWMPGSLGRPGRTALPAGPAKWACTVIDHSGGLMDCRGLAREATDALNDLA